MMGDNILNWAKCWLTSCLQMNPNLPWLERVKDGNSQEGYCRKRVMEEGKDERREEQGRGREGCMERQESLFIHGCTAVSRIEMSDLQSHYTLRCGAF